MIRSDDDGTADVGLAVALSLANDLVIEPADDAAATVRGILSVDPESVEVFHADDTPEFVRLARRVAEIADAVTVGDIDRAAESVNSLLSEQSAHPHLANDGGRWQLHHHPPDAELLAMWSAIVADALARLIGSGRADRLGRCRADDCQRLYFDRSKNGSRRFCSTTCQNRVKAAAFRSRQRAGG